MSLIGQLAALGFEVGPEGVLTIRGPLIARGGVFGGIGTGNIYFLDPANGSDNSGGKHPKRAFKTLAYAYSKLTANQNDTLYYIGGSSSLSISSLLTWAKDYTHFIGVGAPTHMAQRARIFNSGNLNQLLKITATGCIFQNFYIFQGAALSANIGNVEVTGGRNYFNNVHFAGMGHATPGGESGGYSLKLNGAEENLFENCTIGLDTIIRASTNGELLIDGSSNRNEFRNCKFVSYSETLGKIMVKFNDNTAVDRFLIFKDCLFINFWVNHVDKLESCFSIPVSPATCDVILQGQCLLVGIDEWEKNDRGNVWIGNAAPSAATSGIAVEPAT